MSDRVACQRIREFVRMGRWSASPVNSKINDLSDTASDRPGEDTQLAIYSQVLDDTKYGTFKLRPFTKILDGSCSVVIPFCRILR